MIKNLKTFLLKIILSLYMKEIFYHNKIYRVLFEANPIDEDIRKAGFGGINRYADLEGFENSDLVIETTKKIDVLTKQ